MTPGAFRTSILRGAGILRSLGLLGHRNLSPDYSVLVPSFVRATSYPDLWKLCLERELYHLRLVNEGLFQFRQEPDLSYSFLEPPIRPQPFHEFALEHGGEEWEHFRLELSEEYEVYLSSLALDWPATPIRFDHSPATYRSPSHPACHMHFGYSSDIRIATRRILSPEAFVVFVLRQYFPKVWQDFATSNGSGYVSRRCRLSLAEVHVAHWNADDGAELHLI